MIYGGNMKKDFTISENYILPSLGKIYEEEFDPHITIRSMTTADEMKRLSPSELTYKNMCSIIDDCIIEDLPISCYDMCVGDYQFLIHKLRVVTYGKNYPLTCRCSYCGCLAQETVDLDQLQVNEFTESCMDYLEFDLPVTGKHICLNVQTPRMLDKVQERVKEFKKRNKKADIDPTMIYLLCSLIRLVDGKVPDPINIEEWVKKLPMKDVNYILTYADKFNSSIGVDINLNMTCDVCGLDYNVVLVTTNEFFRPRLDA